VPVHARHRSSTWSRGSCRRATRTASRSRWRSR
jgi:hypothetical protein